MCPENLFFSSTIKEMKHGSFEGDVLVLTCVSLLA